MCLAVRDTKLSGEEVTGDIKVGGIRRFSTDISDLSIHPVAWLREKPGQNG
jgi:hypothetical protein